MALAVKSLIATPVSRSRILRIKLSHVAEDEASDAVNDQVYVSVPAAIAISLPKVVVAFPPPTSSNVRLTVVATEAVASKVIVKVDFFLPLLDLYED